MSRKPDLAVAASALPPDKVEEIRTELERVLTSQQFRTSKRCQNLLRHVTEQALTGDTALLKERTLGVDVFGRDPDYDTSQDPVVRATAAEIRKKLAQYYQESAHAGEVRIEVLSGSYVPEFHFNGTTAAAEPEERARRKLPWLLAAIVVFIAIVTGVLVLTRWGRSDLDKFWAPILQAQGNIIISMGQPIALNLRSAVAQDRIQMRTDDAQKTMANASEAITGRDLVILADRYIALGDAECLVRIAALLEKHGKPYRIRGERATSFADVRENAAVFIGAFDNPWTLRAAGQLRFVFVKDSEHDTDMVRDLKHPENSGWKLTGAWPQWDISNDYAIVSRVLDANTDKPFVIAAGITHYGTMAAGEFLTNPEYFAEAAAQLPRGWERRNVQIVLRVPVVHRAAGHPRVLATHVW
jgi:hypothetical protein